MEIVFLSMFFIGVYMNALELINASWTVLIKPLIWFVCWCVISDLAIELLSEGGGQ